MYPTIDDFVAAYVVRLLVVLRAVRLGDPQAALVNVEDHILVQHPGDAEHRLVQAVLHEGLAPNAGLPALVQVTVRGPLNLGAAAELHPDGREAGRPRVWVAQAEARALAHGPAATAALGRAEGVQTGHDTPVDRGGEENIGRAAVNDRDPELAVAHDDRLGVPAPLRLRHEELLGEDEVVVGGSHGRPLHRDTGRMERGVVTADGDLAAPSGQAQRENLRVHMLLVHEQVLQYRWP
mmetsp:Transcript_54762/g.159154  ORF Transcript_54762/g.159154 Transcript_54762/m.159154 type:complete len:237 (-) Transcript_54762:752-1462(-)